MVTRRIGKNNKLCKYCHFIAITMCFLLMTSYRFIGLYIINNPFISNLAPHQYRWMKSKKSTVPLIEPFIGPRNSFTQELIYYQPNHMNKNFSLSPGYSFPCNGQGNKRNNIFYSNDRLKYRLVPMRQIFSKNEAIDCLLSKTKWIHVDGDSLSRDTLYDIQELFGMAWNDKEKTLEDMEFNRGIQTTFSSNTIEFSLHPNWVEFKKGQVRSLQNCPDLWVYTSGLWDHPAKTSESSYRKRTQALANYSNSCVPKYKVLRYTTPYGNQQASSKPIATLNGMAVAYNKIATEILVPKGFHVVDAYTMMEPRGDLSHDGVHYTGPGSKWITNAILNIICPATY